MYAVDEKIGEGSYSRVYRVKIGDELLALKRNVIEKEIKGTGNVRELDILIKCKGHPNIVQLQKISYNDTFKRLFSPIKELDSRDDEIYMIFELGTGDLDEIINKDLDISTIRAIMFQILSGVEFLHRQNIIHRDLKPPNFLIFTEPELRVKICDFGLSNHLSSQGARTPRVCTAEYRAPEIWLGCKKYTEKVDIWSVGCIFFEILKKRTFLTVERGNNDKSCKNIRNLIRVYPKKITREDITAIGGRSIVGKLPKSTTKWRDYFSDEDVPKLAINLLKRMLEFYPEKRWSATQCLDHPFFDPLRDWVIKVRQFPIPEYRYEIEVNPYLRSLIGQLKKIVKISEGMRWFNFRMVFIALNIIFKYVKRIFYDSSFIDYSQLHCYTILYLAVKYLTTSNLNYEPTWDEIVPNNLKGKLAIKQSCKFERKLLDDILDFEVYTPNPYDVANKELTSDETLALFNYMTNNPEKLDGLTAINVFENFDNSMCL